ncbi:hypothetical protein [Streptomyces siamensis]|uniref:Lipoprotein n=1 Tax=Streptomyces siamensis TaxID=1274986 RepID=A0ABP9J8T3_9ACTN
MNSRRIAHTRGLVPTLAVGLSMTGCTSADPGETRRSANGQQGGLAEGGDSGRIARFLADSRLAGEHALARRLARAAEEGDLPAGTDPHALARYVMVVSEGNAVQAAAGAARAALHATVDIALQAIPRSPQIVN